MANPDQPSPFKRPAFLLSAAFLAAVVVMAVIVAVSGGDGSGSSRSGHTTPPATPSGQAAGNRQGCAPSDTAQQLPTSAPQGVTWQAYKGMVLPISATAGPMTMQGDKADCYAHTPVGALIAAAHLGYRYAVASDWRSIAAQLVDGPGKTAWLQQRKANPTPDVPPQGQIGQIAGFRFITYTSDVAVVQLAFRNTMPGSQLPAFTAGIYSLRWQNDWRLQMQQDGSASTEAPNSESLDGYIPWGAV